MQAIVIVVVVAVLVAAQAGARQLNTTSNLYNTNLFIGTGGGGWGIGHNNPGPQYPYSAMRLGPDTALDNVWVSFNHFGGYYWRDTHVRCFSHTHFVGGGVTDWGNFGIMATDKPISSQLITRYGYRSEMDKSSEQAYPGYYSVFLPTHGVLAELTVAGSFTGVHRYSYTYITENPKTVIVDVCHNIKGAADGCMLASVQVDPNTYQISGYIRNKGSLTGRSPKGGIDVYFVARFSTSTGAVPNSFGIWQAETIIERGTNASKGTGESTSLGAYLVYSSTVRDVSVHVGISFISVQAAQQNLEAELNGRTSFADIHAGAVAVWDEQLGKFAVELRPDQSDDDAIEFFTAQYRSMMSPTIYTEANGQFLGFDEAVYPTEPGELRISDLSMWDTFRTQHPWLVLFRPDIALNSIRSMIAMSVESTDLPRWPIANTYTGGMTGDSCNSVIVDYLLKVNANGFNLTLAYEKMRIKSLEYRPNAGRGYVDEFNALGYITVESCTRCAGSCLHYYYDDYAISVAAGYLGLTADRDMFYQRSLNYSKLFSAETQFMCPRSVNGTYVCPPPNNQVLSNEFWIEGNAWHWSFFVQHDPAGLIGLFPSVDAFVAKLEGCFDAYVNAGSLQAANILPNEGYWGGNEPSLYHAWLFNHAGRPALTQYWARRLLEELYSNTPDGLPGNDDYGTMSAWFTFASMGLYPNPPHTYYNLGSPLFAATTTTLPNGATLRIVAYNNTADNVYVTRALWNGAALPTPFIEHSAISQGGLLEFFMSSTSLASAFTF